GHAGSIPALGTKISLKISSGKTQKFSLQNSVARLVKSAEMLIFLLFTNCIIYVIIINSFNNLIKEVDLGNRDCGFRIRGSVFNPF
ncbi:MAG TPA: hypothetical protein PK837_01065, partial [bacterium]|nr:hypothetical protein [bacterium]